MEVGSGWRLAADEVLAMDGVLATDGVRNSAQCPMPYALCPMPYAQLPITNYQSFLFRFISEEVI